MTVKLIQMRFGSKIESIHETITDAAKEAVDDIETNEAAPYAIYEYSVLIWKNTGPFDGSYDRLRELAGMKPE